MITPGRIAAPTLIHNPFIRDIALLPSPYREFIQNKEVFFASDNGNRFKATASPFPTNRINWNMATIEVYDISSDSFVGFLDLRDLSKLSSGFYDIYGAALRVEEYYTKNFKGLGSALLSFALSLSWAAGQDTFFVVNSIADQFYEKHGFTRKNLITLTKPVTLENISPIQVFGIINRS